MNPDVGFPWSSFDMFLSKDANFMKHKAKKTQIYLHSYLKLKKSHQYFEVEVDLAFSDLLSVGAIGHNIAKKEK